MNKVLGGLKLVGLSFLLAAAVSVACGREPVAPLPVELPLPAHRQPRR